MTSVGRLHVVGGTLLTFCVLWASIAADPWASARPDPLLAALARREAVIRKQTVAAQRAYTVRWTRYQEGIARQRALHAAMSTAPAPQVRLVQLPPVATTRSS
jgi:hypothetical protein